MMYSQQDVALLCEGMESLCDTLGPVRAVTFITLIKKKGFDYTEWRQDNLWKGMNCKEVSEDAIKIIEEHFHELPENIQNDIKRARELRKTTTS